MKIRHFKEKVVPKEDIAQLSQELKNKNKKIISTNGCFDIIHQGHVEYLYYASELGDILIVAINSDESVKRLKGRNRPVNSEKSRAAVIAALGFVDYCVIFSEYTPVNILQQIKPHIHIKGGDYKADEIPEKGVVEDNGGIIKIVPLFEGFSSSNIIQKVQSLD